VFINYDVNDRVKRIGSVYMTYNRYALERWFRNYIQSSWSNCRYCGICARGRGYAYNQTRTMATAMAIIKTQMMMTVIIIELQAQNKIR
jgi:sulfur relay (sulfurtransferase) complex TusBCD TusD component (DsrE family)